MVYSIEALSTISTPLDLYFDRNKIGRASAFFYNYDGDTYLVTCLHNLTGKDPFKGIHISKNLVEPNYAEIILYTEHKPVRRKRFRIPIFIDNKPIWKSDREGKTDIAIIKFSKGLQQLCANHLESKDPPIPRVGGEAFVLGYPRGVSVRELPIWKRATIASEWSYNVDKKDAFLIDTASTSGMSGAPVVFYSQHGETESGKNWGIRDWPMIRLLGVYSGREGESENLLSQLGLVWRRDKIDEILRLHLGKFNDVSTIPLDPVEFL